MYVLAAIKAYLNCSSILSNELAIEWTTRRQLALDTSKNLGADLSNVVALLDSIIYNQPKIDNYSCFHNCNILRTKVAMIIETEVARGNLMLDKPEAKLKTLSMKELWFLVVQCFENLSSFTQIREKEPGVQDWLNLKEILHAFEWMKDKIDKLHDKIEDQEELLWVWSIAWLRLKEQINKSIICENDATKRKSLDTGAERTIVTRISQTVVDINDFLEPQLHQFSIVVRQFWTYVGFMKVWHIYKSVLMK